MESLLGYLGINIASSVIDETLKNALKSSKSKEELIEIVASRLSISNANIAADRIIKFAAENGDIFINGSTVYASESITMQSTSGTKFIFGNGSTSKTLKSEISAGQGTKIEGSGGAKIDQHPDGSITFSI